MFSGHLLTLQVPDITIAKFAVDADEMALIMTEPSCLDLQSLPFISINEFST